MTLFAAAAPDIPIFQQALEKNYNGLPDQNTIELLKL